MATIGRKAYTQALTTILSTEFNSLASGSSTAASSAVDNSTNLDLYIDLLGQVTFGTAPTASGTLDVYLLPSLDNTTFEDAKTGASPFVAKAMYLGAMELQAIVTAQAKTLTWGPLPQYFKLVVVNNSGTAFPASGSTLKYRTFSLQSV